MCNFKKNNLFLILLFLNAYLSVSQPIFVVDTILFPGQYIEKVSASRSSDVWIIKNIDSKSVYRIDKNLVSTDFSPLLLSNTSSKFTAILNNDTNNTLVGTENDYVYHLVNGNIYKRDASSGIFDSTINAIVGFPKLQGITQNTFVGVSANTANSFTTSNLTNYNATPTNPSLKTLEFNRYFTDEYYLYKYKDPNTGYDLIMDVDPASIYIYGMGQNWQNINTATWLTTTSPMLLVGSDTKLMVFSINVFTTFLSGFKINKVMKYKYNNTHGIVASDSGLYVFTYLPLGVTKASFPENTFKANDIDMSPDGCVWVATDVGLFKLKDSNCNNYTSDFSFSDTLLTLNDSCTININGQCTNCIESWNWSFGDGTTSNLPNPSHSYSQSGNYTISLITENGICKDTVTKTISILVCCDSANYNLFSIGNDTTVCFQKTLSAPNFVNSTYLWSTGDTTSSILVNSSGNYSVAIKNENGCVSYDSIHLTVIPATSVSINNFTNSICSNQNPISLTGSPIGGSFSIDDIVGNIIYPDTLSATGHLINYTYSDNNGCSTTFNDTFIVYSAPVLNINGLSNGYCINSTPITLIASPSGGTFSGLGVVGDSLTPSLVNNDSTLVIYSYTDINGCSNADTQKVSIYPIPELTIFGLSNNYCINEGVQLISANPTGGVFSGNGINGNTFTPNSISAGTHTITYEYSNTCSNSISHTVNIIPAPTISIFSPQNICSGDQAILSINGIGHFLWNTGDTTTTIHPAPTTNTTYYATSTNLCGTTNDSATIVVNPLPVAQISNDTTILAGSSVSMAVTGGASYLWNNYNTLSCETCFNPVATPVQTTTYSVIISNIYGCSITKNITIIVNDNFQLFIPDIFSPNGDGQNDILFVRGWGIKKFNFSIYDRLGEKLFETTNLDKGWDGTYKGSPVKSDVFVYYLTAELENGEVINTKGDITLIR